MKNIKNEQARSDTPLPESVAKPPEGTPGYKPPEPAKVQAKPEPDPKALTHRVAPKRAVKTRSGVLPVGTLVSAELVGGFETLAALERGGSVVKA
jgi:hypothetical protein